MTSWNATYFLRKAIATILLSISSTFYSKLLQVQIQKPIKIHSSHKSFCTVGIFVHKMWVKSAT